MERVLFVTSTRIGDAVLGSGVLAHLVDARPEARFTIAAGPLAAPLFRAVPRLDRLIIVQKRPLGGHWPELWARTAAKRWNLSVDLRGSRTASFLRADQRLVAGRPRTDLHKVEEAGEVLGLSPPPDPRVWIDAAAETAARAAYPEDGPILAIAPAAAMPFKEWPPERFAATARALTGPGGALEGGHVAILGGPGDEAIALAAADGLEPAKVRILAGRLDILAAAALIRRARLFVGNDSGLMHIAAAVGTPTLGLFGPTDERVYGPWGGAARSVRAGGPADAAARDRLKRAETSLLGDLDVATVVDAAGSLLQSTEGRAHG